MRFCVKSLQLCLTLCNSVNCSPPGSPVLGILQARILEWVAMSFSRGSSWPRDQTVSPAPQLDSLLLSHQESPCWLYKCINPLFWDSITIQIIIEYWTEFPKLYSRFSIVTYFIHSSVIVLIQAFLNLLQVRPNFYQFSRLRCKI